MIEEAIASIKNGKPDLVIITEVATKILPNLAEPERNAQRQRLKAALSKQKPTEEILWSMAVFKFDDLLIEKIQTIAKSSTFIDLNFQPSMPGTVSIISYLAYNQQEGVIKVILENPQQFSQLNWNAAPAAGPNKGKSILWFVAGHRQWDLIKIILENPQQHIQLNWNAVPAVGPDKGMSALWLLAAEQQLPFIKIILEDLQQFPQLNWNAATVEGPNKGKSILWLLACHRQWDLIKVILENPQQHTQLNWNATTEEGADNGRSVLWLLADNQQWELIKIVLENPQRFPQLDWNAAPAVGLDKNKTVLWLLAHNQQWSLIKVILEHPEKFPSLELNTAPIVEMGPAPIPAATSRYMSIWEMLVNHKQLKCIQLIAQNLHSYPMFDFKSILQNQHNEFKSIILKTCLLAGRAIPSNDAKAIAYYQRELDKTFAAVANSVLNNWDESNFKVLPAEILESLLKLSLYAYDPELMQIPWKLITVNVNVYVNKNEAKLQEDAYHLTARWAVGKFFSNQAPETKTGAKTTHLKTNANAAAWLKDAYHLTTRWTIGKFFSKQPSETKTIANPMYIETSANVAAWLKQANSPCFFLTQDKRAALVNEIAHKSTLDQASVTQSFEVVFGGNSK